MKSCTRVLVLLALFALIPCAHCLAQAPTAPTDLGSFLATLSVDPNGTPTTPSTPPAPRLASTLCDTDDDCPQGQLCCYPCGIDGCHNVCMAPLRKGGGCPLFP